MNLKNTPVMACRTVDRSLSFTFSAVLEGASRENGVFTCRLSDIRKFPGFIGFSLESSLLDGTFRIFTSGDFRLLFSLDHGWSVPFRRGAPCKDIYSALHAPIPLKHAPALSEEAAWLLALGIKKVMVHMDKVPAYA